MMGAILFKESWAASVKAHVLVGLAVLLLCLPMVSQAGAQPAEAEGGQPAFAQNPSADTPTAPAEASEPVEEAKPERAKSTNHPGVGIARGPLVETEDGIVFDLGIRYEANMRYIKPLQLNGAGATDVLYTVQRGRTHAVFAWKNHLALNVQVDLFDGVLFGDNGLTYGDAPQTTEGLSTTARTPNNAGLDIVLIEGMDPNNSDSYTYGLKSIEPIALRRVWGEVDLILGRLAVGRMPANDKRGILLNGGDYDNRFGQRGPGDSSDRILFGTKPIQLFKAAMAGDPSAADTRQDRGLIWLIDYSHLVTDLPQILGDDARQMGTKLSYKLPEFIVGAVDGSGLLAALSYAHRWSKDVELAINFLVGEFQIGIENFQFELQAAGLIGQTREVSDAQSLFRTTGRGSSAVVQDVRSWGMFFIADYTIGPVMLTFEFDYASGDDDPRADTELNQFYFADDTKVGLLLFPQVLAYETGRSAAAARNFINQAEAPDDIETTANPASAIKSDGGFTNAIAIFPQITYNATDWFFIRLGTLIAWSAKPVVDPYETNHRYDADDIEDDKVNFNGGKPGSFYGTEVDLRLSFLLWQERFLFDLEGAMLFPGDALQDQHGVATTSGLVQGRFTFQF